ncbi:MAG: hypothetical protein Fur002_14110 [Anaerolineales bacterium]
MKKFTRRDFLKTAALTAAGLTLPRILSRARSAEKPNIIVLVFDAMSARNLSVYGYPRKTTPNFERFAQRAFVYHAHQSAGNYTTPGTASLLAGTYPWTHRALNHGGKIATPLAARNIFQQIGADYQRYAFTQNSWANIFLNQFQEEIDVLLPPRSFETLSPFISGEALPDGVSGYQALDSFLFSKSEVSASLLFGAADKLYWRKLQESAKNKNYPRGLPEMVTAPFYFETASLFDGLQAFAKTFQPPFFAYLHVFPPHEPYRPTREFFNHFKDGWNAPEKPVHRFVQSPNTEQRLNDGRLNYDRFIANLDAEFGRLMDTFEEQNLFENSYIVLTSDHGDMFERGERGHSTPLLYDAVIHAPLLISAPGKSQRTDIHAPTSGVDLLPTLLKLAGQEIPAWSEGLVLPGLGGEENPNRAIFSVEAKQNSAFTPLTKATIAMRKGKYKLIYYTGYEAQDTFELYDMENDPEEMKDSYAENDSRAKALREELLSALEESNQRLKEIY